MIDFDARAMILLLISKKDLGFKYSLMRKDPRFAWTSSGPLLALNINSLQSLHDTICDALAVDGQSIQDQPSYFSELRGKDWTKFCKDHYEITISRDSEGRFEIPCPHHLDSEGNSIASKDSVIILSCPIDQNALFEAICRSAKIGPIHRKRLSKLLDI